jgi:predicted PurR-regulated permease PerM
MTNDRLQNFAFFALFAGVSVLLFFVFSPFIHILALGAVFAILLERPYERLSRLLGGSKSAAAALVVFLLLLFVIVPLFFLGTQIFLEAQTLYVQSPDVGVQYVETLQSAIIHFVQRFSPTFTFNAALYVGNVLSFISTNLAALVSGTVYLLLETFLMLLAFFFFLRDGRGLLTSLEQASPFGKKETDEILRSMYQTIQTVVKGTLLVAAIRWICIGIAFYIFGIPNAVLWGSVGGIVGAIPGLGALLVFVPATLYLYLQGQVLGAIGIAIFGLLVIIFVDNLLTPYFFGKGLEVPQIFVLFSVLGGIIFFGPVGFILGPLVLSIFLSLLRIYSSQTSSKTL